MEVIMFNESLYVLITVCLRRLILREKIIAIFLDFSKTFDRGNYEAKL